MHRKVKCKNKTDQNQELSVRDSFIGGGGGGGAVRGDEIKL